MSRAGREALADDRRRVTLLVSDAAERFQQDAETQPEAPEIPEEVQVAWRAQQLHRRCKAVIVERYPTLWPAETIGAAIAEQWLMNIQRRLMQARANEAGLLLPS